MTKENYKEFMDSLIVQKNPNRFLVLSFMVNMFAGNKIYHILQEL